MPIGLLTILLSIGLLLGQVASSICLRWLCWQPRLARWSRGVRPRLLWTWYQGHCRKIEALDRWTVGHCQLLLCVACRTDTQYFAIQSFACSWRRWMRVARPQSIWLNSRLRLGGILFVPFLGQRGRWCPSVRWWTAMGMSCCVALLASSGVGDRTPNTWRISLHILCSLLGGSRSNNQPWGLWQPSSGRSSDCHIPPRGSPWGHTRLGPWWFISAALSISPLRGFFYLLLSVGRTVLKLPSLQTPRSSFLASVLGFLVIQTQRIPAEGTLTLKSAKSFDTRFSKHCIWWRTWFLEFVLFILSLVCFPYWIRLRSWTAFRVALP